LFDGRFRKGVDRAVRPIGTALVRTGLAPDHLTAFGLALSVPTAFAIATGHLGLGLALLIFSAVPDLLDGALAKASQRSTVRGAFLDSVCDRVTDTFVLGGIAWYLQSRYGGHAAMLPFAVLGASVLISYLRAKAESLGFDAKGGIMERAERIVVLCVGLAFSVLLVPLLWVMLALTLLTAGQRFAKVWRQATLAEGLGSARRRAAAIEHAEAGADHASAGVGPLVSVDHHAPAAQAAVPLLDPLPADAMATRAAAAPMADAPMADAPMADAPAAVTPAVETPEPETPAVVPERPEVVPSIQPVAARWRAWRESTGWVPRNERYTHGYRRDGAGERWRERRLARKQEFPVESGRRRRGSRRP
jgi:CDP-diacylglycerol--glycerol-3-phosphate 3-phosphatidyltransferase